MGFFHLLIDFKKCLGNTLEHYLAVFFFISCNRHRFNRVPGAPPRDGLGVTYLPSTISSDAGYADLPLALLGAPVSIGALLEPGSRSPGAEPQDRDWSGRPPGQDALEPRSDVSKAG